MLDNFDKIELKIILEMYNNIYISWLTWTRHIQPVLYGEVRAGSLCAACLSWRTQQIANNVNAIYYKINHAQRVSTKHSSYGYTQQFFCDRTNCFYLNQIKVS